MSLRFREASVVELLQKTLLDRKKGAFVDETKQLLSQAGVPNDPRFLSVTFPPAKFIFWTEATVEEGRSPPVAANRSRHTGSNQQHLDFLSRKT